MVAVGPCNAPVDSGPSKAPRSRKKVLDPAIITVTRPHDVVREVIERTGINRTTAQRMTADMRAEMRRKRKGIGFVPATEGRDRATVARAVAVSDLGYVQKPKVPD
jgi:Holliday junction resolvasome RuvABC DNA-binding subunit